jgi:signal transduction histidine kinase
MYSFKQIALLIICTAGTVLYLFLLTLFASLRRRKAFEVVLFLTGIATFLMYAGKLLELNIKIYYLHQGTALPGMSMAFAGVIAALGASLFPPLLVHAHFEYRRRQDESRNRRWVYSIVGLFYLTAVLSLILWGMVIFAPDSIGSDTLRSIEVWLIYPWVSLAFFLSALLQLSFARRENRASLYRLHVALAVSFLIPLAESFIRGTAAMSGLVMHFIPVSRGWGLDYWILLVPGALLGYYIIRDRFLAFGVQRNLVFTVTAAFLAVLYLTFARRMSTWLEPFFPPVATESVLIFVLVMFFAPIQRRMGAVLQRAFRAEAEQLQRLTAEIQHVARAGDLNELITFAETRIRESFSLSGVRISLHDGPARPAAVSGNVQHFILRNGPAEIGVLEAYFFGQTLSGETHAALDYLAEQLPAAIDLCRLLDEKLRLERELAERERLALLGQMAASVSHNLRNPLSSIKTLLQLQLENPGLPVSARPDCEKAIAEVDRLNTKLTQLLRYAKPAVHAASGITAVSVDVAAISAQTVSLLQHEAERRGVSLSLDGVSEKIDVSGTEESLSDVLSNLIVNAIEAVPAGGTVRVRLARRDAAVVLEILDDGLGIPEYVGPRIFQPFFTTKPTGTGLGLAIVEKRLAEIGATIECQSPVLNARGTRFTVILRGG